MNDDEQARRFREQDENATQQRAALLSMSYFDTRGVTEAAQLYNDIFTVKEMYDNKIIPLVIGNDSQNYTFGVTTTTPQSAMRSVQSKFAEQGHGTSFVLISNSGFRDFMRRYDPPKEVHYDDVTIAKEGDSETLAQVSSTLESVSSDKILDYIIDQADRLGASDIHIETQKDVVRIRLRVDGALHPIAEISHDKYRVLTAAIASRANLSTAAQSAQTGHLQGESQQTPGKLISMRIETIPTSYGIDAVIRLFNFDESLLNLEHLGLDLSRREQIDEIVKHPHGMLLVVGPTGSGKSTTLFSIIKELNDPSRKIITLEDPVEITVPGVSQIPVNTGEGASFADNLRAVLRLDPDIVMVGEIRDNDTAKTAIQASITGHLVLSTFHASSAAAAFSRMIDMIGQNPIFANAIRMVISQRLVRRLDDTTKIAYEPDEATKNWIRGVLREVPEGTDVPNLDNIRLWKPGTSEQYPFGYTGRIIIMEQLLVTEKIQKFIRGEMKDIDVASIESVAREDGMLTMLQDGILRALLGQTTIEEVNRVV